MLGREEIIYLLDKHRIPWKDWGRGSRKGLGDLVNSIKLGETRLEAGSSKLILHVRVAVVTVRFKLNGQWLELREDRQEFIIDGKVSEIKRRTSFNGSLGEKIRRNESPITTARRGLREELGFPKNSGYKLSYNGLEIMKCESSDWYSGLIDVYHRYHFVCLIPPELYRSKYTERYLHRTIYFEWTPISIP